MVLAEEKLHVYDIWNSCYITKDEGTRKDCFFIKEEIQKTENTKNTNKQKLYNKVRQINIEMKLEKLEKGNITLSVEAEHPTIIINEVPSTGYVIF